VDTGMLDKLKEVVGNDTLKAYEVLKEQTPELLDQYIKWMLYSNIATSVFFGLIIIICTIILITQCKKESYNRSEGSIIASGMVGLFSFLPLIASITCSIKIILFPKLYVVTWLLSNIK